MAEYKLSYTASEIDEKLGKIDENTTNISKLSEEIADIKENGTGGGIVVSSVEPETDDIPKVFLNGDEFSNMTKDKNEVNMELDYISMSDRFHAYIKIKYQGSSSLQHAKKNFTVKLYSDETRETKFKQSFKGWGEQSKYVFKANYIDHTHARNIVTARLWADIVKSRSDYTSLPEELRTSPNQGAVDGFPIKLYVNGVYQGIYTWNIPKDGWMNNMDKDLDNHCMLCGEMNAAGTNVSTNPCMFRSASVVGWTDELHDTMPDNIKTSWENVISFVMNSTNEEFVAGLDNYMDVQSVIDFCILARIARAVDNLGKNQMFFTYDGTKWLESVYDLDSTWGSNPWGKLDTNSEITEFQSGYINVTEGGYSNLLYERVELLFMERLKARYTELRSSALSVSNIIASFERFTDIISNDLYEEDTTIFNIPSATNNNIQQIREFVVKRLAYMDGVIDAMAVPVLATGILLDQTTATIQGADTLILTATVTPSDTTEKVSWKSSDETIATVKDGVVTSVSNGNCIITATIGSYSATCTVTVENIVTKYFISRNLVGCTSSSESTIVNEGDSHTETISANDGYSLSEGSVSVTMSGSDVTNSVYNNGVITISAVTGDIVISASAEISINETSLVYSLPETTAFDGTNTVDTGFQVTENKSFSILLTVDDYAVITEEPISRSICSIGSAKHMGWININANGKNSYDYDSLYVRMFGWSPAIGAINNGLDVLDGSGFKLFIVYDADAGTVTTRAANKGVALAVANASQSVTYKAWTSTLKLGQANDDANSPSFIGTISDFRIYERVLTESETNAYLGI